MGHMIATLRAEINSYQAELTRLRAEKAELVEEMANKEDFFNEHYFGSELFVSDGFENIFELDSQQPTDKRPEELQAVM